MKLETNKDIGNAGLSLAIAYFGSNGYTVSIPMNDTQDYDLVVDNGEGLKSVQVKATTYQRKNNFYTVNLKSTGGTNGGIYKRVSDTEIDILFVVCGNKDLFLIPKEELTNISTVTLNEKYSSFKVEI